MCMCNFACKGRPRNDLYCVGWDIKPYSLSHFCGTLEFLAKKYEYIIFCLTLYGCIFLVFYCSGFAVLLILTLLS